MHRARIQRILGTLVAGAAALTVSTAFAAGSGGVTDPHFYANGVLYRTVGTPTDFSGTGAPASSYETLYDLGGFQPNVVAAAPGDPGFKGGRWQVHAIAYNSSYTATLAAHDLDADGVLDSAAEVTAALADAGTGGAHDLGIAKMFECPVIPVPGN